MHSKNEVELSFDARSVNEGFARMAVAAFITELNPTMDELSDVKTAVSEAVTNAIIHGYDNPEEKVHMTCRIMGREVEIIVCPEVARREAEKRSLPYSREVVLYLVHGLLHASGEDDLKPELKRKMRRREHKTMNELEKLFTFSDIFPEPVLMGDTHT